jgi:Ca2+-binding RTX toxin-like protein
MLSFQLELLARVLLAAGLNNGLLTVTGTNDADTILIIEADDQIVVEVSGAQTAFDEDDVQEISIDALGGDDTITVNVDRPTSILGGAGNDTITGSDGGDDNVFGNQGADTFFGRGGDDLFVWNPGDGNDVIDGNDDDDTHVFNGSGADETMVVEPNGLRVRLTRNVGNIVMDIGTFENVTINALGGADTVSGAVGLLPLLELLTIDGGEGDDILNGGDGDDLLLGGGGLDTVDGNRGADTAFLGAGDDIFIWDPGDGSDAVEGEDGFDELVFNGAGAAELFDVSPDGDRVLFFRNLGNINMDLDGVEAIHVATLGGPDEVTVNDTAGTDLELLTIELEGSIGGGTGDGEVDVVIANGGDADEVVVAAGDAATGVSIAGLSAAIDILHLDPAIEKLNINPMDGDDTADATGLAAGAAVLTVDGGAGDDTILGGPGADLLGGGGGDDFIDGNQGADTAFMGGGDDTFQWDPGDGSDFVEGEAGFDTLLFNGSAASEIFDASANGDRLRFFRNLGSIVMDVGTTEQIDLRALGGDDATTINDLSGTGVTDVLVDAGDGNDTFLGSDLAETFLAGNGDDTVTIGDRDFFDMGAGIDTLLFHGTTGRDNIHVDGKTRHGHEEAFFHGTVGKQRAVFDNGEIVTVFTEGGNDKVKVHRRAEDRWAIDIVE